MNKKGVMKLGVFLSFSLILILILTFFATVSTAEVEPGDLRPLYEDYSLCAGNLCPAWVNLTKGDMFFIDNTEIYIVVNYTCTNTSVCNESMTVTGNFSETGGSSNRIGVFKQKAPDNSSWAVFELNDTINFSAIGSPIMMDPKNITLNATDGNTSNSFYLDGIFAPVILVNMTYPPGCPPSSQQLPPQIPLLNGTLVSISGCNQTCTGEDRAEYNGTYWNICGPIFGGDTTNFTALAYDGNFSNFNLVIDIPEKAKINFTTNVSMSDPRQSQALFEFAVKNIMAGPRIGINATEWNGTEKPNLNLSARLTIYNLSRLTGITGRPQIFKYDHGGLTGIPCPSSICSDFEWDGENITFSVSSFSDYGLTDAINVTLQTPSNLSYYNLSNINFTYIPEWNSSVTMDNCTLYGNFTGSWGANETNQSELVNGSVNWINTTVDSNGYYSWNVYCYDTTGQYDYYAPNWTVIVDVKPTWTSNISSTPTNYSPSTLSEFNITWDGFIDDVFITIRNSTTVLINNATMTNTYGGDIYNFSTALPAGTWNWTSYANDTSTNWNSSDVWTFSINNASNPVTLYFNGSANQNKTYFYPESINATAVGGGTVYLHRNDTEVASGSSPQTEEILLGNNTYTYKVNATGNQNYTDNSTGVTYYVFVNKGTTNISLWLNGTEGSRSYNQYDIANFTAQVNVSGLTINLTSPDYPDWIQQNDTTTVYNITNLSSIGIYNITAYTEGNENYSAFSTTYYFDTREPYYYNLTAGPAYYSPDQNYSFNITITDASVQTVIFRLYNATNISGGLVDNTTINPSYVSVNTTTRTYYAVLTDLPAGTYNYSWFVNDTLGGNNSTSNITYTIAKADAISLTASETAVTSGTSTTVTCVNSNEDANRTEVTETLKLETTIVANPDTEALPVGTWTYYCTAPNTGNYTNIDKSISIIVSATSTPISPSSGITPGGTTPTNAPTVSVRVGKVNITMVSLTTGSKLIANIARVQDVAIRGLNITVVNNVGNIKIMISKLSVLPSTVAYDIAGKVYHYINIEKVNITESDINVVNFEFAVNKTWLTDNNVDSSNITLYRWANNRWNNLNTTKITENDQEAFYNANSPGLSVFIIGTTGGAPELPETPSGAAIICEENWQCTDWSDCINKTKTRICTDASNCGTSNNKPAESQDCELEGAVIGPRAVSLLTHVIVIIFAIIVCILIFLQRARITSYLQALSKKIPKMSRKKSTKVLEEAEKFIVETEDFLKDIEEEK